ncbi:MAG: cytochrome c biogenesis protein ResB [Candidatus Hydrogenedentes bacterium]|nr:cytochrome c biogenesis protein ResB [Candidatus Hydrogenedentota bacterium]
MKALLKQSFDFIASYGFACIIFILLLILTFFGTLEQVHQGLYEVQKKYFESMFVVHWMPVFGDFSLPIPLPGVYLLMVLFTVNLIAGGVVRIRKNKNTVGNLITHLGMLVMVFAAFVNYTFAEDGHMTLAENEQASEFVSYYLWEIAIAQPEEGQVAREMIVPHDSFAYVSYDDSPKTFANATLPFDLSITAFYPNSVPVGAGPFVQQTMKVVDGFALQEMDLDKEAERNVAGAYVLVKEKQSGATHEGILWGLADAPWSVTIDGKKYTVDLRRKRYPLPFTIALDKFHQENHPGTGMARMFMSEVTKIEESGARTPVKIQMNEPLRHLGYTFYQASWQPADPVRGTPVRSTLAVVKNPSDQWPLYSCIIITIGLTIHFAGKLAKYIRSENRKLATRKAT